MAHPNETKFIEMGIFKCMAALIWKGLKYRRWLCHDQNIYIPYYATHIIGSYTINMVDFAETAINAGVIPPLDKLLRGSHNEIVELCIQLAMSSLEIVYSHFYQYADRRLSYHCDLLMRGMGGVEMESISSLEIIYKYYLLCHDKRADALIGDRAMLPDDGTESLEDAS
ncbi:putative ARM-repeat/tetratricopeptide repeat-like protein [Tanacetum coccineum]|uniref:ARM-repeat/tetratricopeptide repeat-like protein n=1 Tax=Tanacetum coccineum TaxID=301880 RepID=A0ABQ4WLI0_9ASTR